MLRPRLGTVKATLIHLKEGIGVGTRGGPEGPGRRDSEEAGGRGPGGGGRAEHRDDLRDRRQEFKENVDDRLDHFDDRMDRIEERIERLERRS